MWETCNLSKILTIHLLLWIPCWLPKSSENVSSAFFFLISHLMISLHCHFWRSLALSFCEFLNLEDGWGSSWSCTWKVELFHWKRDGIISGFWLKATLQDAAEKQFSDEAIKDWLWKLKDAAYELDDILDECAYEALGLEYQGVKSGLSHKVQYSCLSSFHPKHVDFWYKIAKRMKMISERLDEIAEERKKVSFDWDNSR